MLTAILTILLFCIMIIPHEFGHFVTAKWMGVQVNEFSVGMGPAIYQKQKGETLISVRAVPLGGYCAMEGENEESENPRAFNNKKGWQKMLVLFAGAGMNILTAILLMIIAMNIIGMPTNTLGEVTEDGPAAAAGLKAGDTIIEVDGTSTSTWNEVVLAINDAVENDTIEFTVLREDSEETFTVTPTLSEDEQRKIVGITSHMSHNPILCARYGVIATWNLNREMLSGFKLLFTGKLGTDAVSGPVGIVTLVNQTTSAGVVSFLYLAALVCLNLAIINLLPFPALDGGRILFVIIRKITGSMISDDMEGRVHMIGMMLLLTLFVFVTWNDIIKLFS